jgi:hypothetical protein
MVIENHDAHERLMRLLPLCRPPYPSNWLECSQADRVAADWSRFHLRADDPLKRAGVPH